MKVTVLQYARTLLELTENKSEEQVSDIVKKFAEQLNRDGQLKNAGKIMEKFSEIYNEKNGIIEALVISSRKLEENQIEEIKIFVKEKYSAKEVVIENVIDENIKGGVIIKVRYEIIDGSVATHLKKLRKELMK